MAKATESLCGYVFFPPLCVCFDYSHTHTPIVAIDGKHIQSHSYQCPVFARQKHFEPLSFC